MISYRDNDEVLIVFNRFLAGMGFDGLFELLERFVVCLVALFDVGSGGLQSNGRLW